MEDSTANPIRLLMVEDVEADAERAVDYFTRAGLRCQVRRVETRGQLLAALGDFSPTVILSDYSLPQFDGMSALKACREQAPSVPFVFVSGTIGEERAVAALQAGAADYVLKENLTRLVPAVRRAIGDAAARAEREQQQQQIERLNRVLRVLGGVNELVIRLRDRTELLAETCRLAVGAGGYALAIAATASRNGATVKAVASDGMDEDTLSKLRAAVENAAEDESSVIGSVFGTGRQHVREALDGEGAAGLETRLFASGMRSLVALPLLVDAETSAVLLLAARDPARLGAGELDMLGDLVRNLSFGLQYVNRDTRMRFLSHFHPQTGLARRQLFCDRVREQAAADPAAGLAVAVLDLRSLSAINDSFGRHVGDQLLRQVADRLKQHAVRQERLGHFGGGTFALCMPCGAGEAPGMVAEVVQKLFTQPLHIEERLVPVAARIGFALGPGDGDGTTLVQNAEAALYLARATGRAQMRFDAAARVQSVGQLAMEHRLRFAIDRNEFELHYQPKVDVATRRIHGAEALLRWRSPEDGLMQPALFLGVLESSGLIAEVGDWVVRQAAADCRQWQAAGLPPVRVAVNISPAQLRAHDFEERFLAQVEPWAGPSHGLDIEITESVLQEDCDAEIHKLERLRAAGVRIAVDDFGTGYSSLSRLSSLPVDTLKIDRRFVLQLVDNPRGASVVKTVVELARAFDMTSVAEGVERQGEFDMLLQLGCDQSQGYLHSVPLPAPGFAALLRNGSGRLALAPDLADGTGETPPLQATDSPAPAR
jgi:diguanylate cyclase (GGDEF)-like protein